MALKQLIKTQMNGEKRHRNGLKLRPRQRLGQMLLKKKTVRNCGVLLDQYARGRVLTQVPQAYEGESLLRNRNIEDPRFEDEND